MADTTTTAEKEAPNDLVIHAQTQADELLEISGNNVYKVMEREQKLSHLNEISTILENEADVFINQAEPIKRKNWMKKFEKKIVVCSILFIILLVVILLLIRTFSK